MIDLAIKHEYALREKFVDTWYDDKYRFYHTSWRKPYEAEKDDWNGREFVSLDKDGKVIGYISYSIDRAVNKAHSLSAINFSDNKYIFGKDLCTVVREIFCKYNMDSLEFIVVIGNPAERSYDKMVDKYGGRVVGIRRKVKKLIDNKIYDDKIYEILREDFIAATGGIE